MIMKVPFYWLLFFCLWLLTACSTKKPLVVEPKPVERPPLLMKLDDKGLQLGAPVFIRIFKEESELELWMQPQPNQPYQHFSTYLICNYSGDLGPKRREGDFQSPEGFYTVNSKQLKADSRYHRAFNLGFPNVYDRAHGYTGSYLMVHGACVSVGCYAMRDEPIEEIYQLVEAALKNGQPFFSVHAMPFRMTDARLAQEKGNRWHPFWLQLQQGYQLFERFKIPPNIQVEHQKYLVTPSA